MTAAQLAAKAGVTTRTVRFYTAERVLPAPEFRGAATRYGREHLVCLAAIRWLQRERGMSLPTIRDCLRNATADEMERMAVALLPDLAGNTGTTVVAAPAAVQAPAASARPVPINDVWHRLTVLPGLEIHCHSAASAEVQALARRLVDDIRRA
jgi:DNA-binding transcriptional MerR regulator